MHSGTGKGRQTMIYLAILLRNSAVAYQHLSFRKLALAVNGV